MKDKCVKILASLALFVMMFNCIGKDVLAYNISSSEDSIIESKIEVAVLGDDTPILPQDPEKDKSKTEEGDKKTEEGDKKTEEGDKKTEEESKTENKNLTSAQKKEQEQMSNVAKDLKISGSDSSFTDGVVGILYSVFIKMIPIGIGYAAQSLATSIGNSAGTTSNAKILLPEQILFNQVAITDINFFGDTYGSGDEKKPLPPKSPVKDIRAGIVKWYKVLRTIAIITLLCILIYVGIRAAISSVAEEKARYKSLIWNWAISMGLLFVLHYFMIIVININDSFVGILYKTMGKSSTEEIMYPFIQELFQWTNNPGSVLASVSSVLVYLGIVMLTFIFLLMYIKRMITVAFLIIIAPLITITYSIDKIGDGKSQALDAWSKEFLHNILIQPFHCIIYLAFVSIAISCIKADGTMAAGVICVMCMFFILQSEKIVKKIFGLNTDSTGDGMGTAAALIAVGSSIKSNMGKAKKAASNVKNNVGSNVAKTENKTVPNKNTTSNNAKRNLEEEEKANKERANTARNNNFHNDGQGVNIPEIEPSDSSEHTQVMDTSHAEKANEQPKNYKRKQKSKKYKRRGQLEKLDKRKKGQKKKTIKLKNENMPDRTSNEDMPTGTSNEDMPTGTSNENNSSSASSIVESILKGAAKGAEYAAKGAKIATKTAAKTSVGLTGAMISGMATGISTGDLSKATGAAIAGGAAGVKMADSAMEAGGEIIQTGRAKFDSFMQERKVSKAEENLANAYNKMKDEHGYSDELMQRIGNGYQNLSDADIDKMNNESAKSFARAVKAVPIIYAEAGKEDPNHELAETLRKIQNANKNKRKD